MKLKACTATTDSFQLLPIIIFFQNYNKKDVLKIPALIRLYVKLIVMPCHKTTV